MEEKNQPATSLYFLFSFFSINDLEKKRFKYGDLQFCYYNSLKDELIVMVIFEENIDYETFDNFFKGMIHEYNTHNLFLEENKKKNFFTRKKLKNFEETMLHRMVAFFLK